MAKKEQPSVSLIDLPLRGLIVLFGIAFLAVSLFRSDPKGGLRSCVMRAKMLLEYVLDGTQEAHFADLFEPGCRYSAKEIAREAKKRRFSGKFGSPQTVTKIFHQAVDLGEKKKGDPLEPECNKAFWAELVHVGGDGPYYDAHRFFSLCRRLGFASQKLQGTVKQPRISFQCSKER